MTTNANTTRRAILAGTAAIPALALPALATAKSDDPAVAAFRVWRAADEAHRHYINDVCRGAWADDDPEERRLHDAEWKARKALAETVATTPAGTACQLRLALDTFGNLAPQGNIDNPDDFEFGAWADDLDGKVLRNLLVGAEQMAGRTVA